MCITKRWLCDGYSDCPNGDDEHQDICQQRSSFGGVLGDELEVEPGEELAGSAPAPSIRKPNKLPIHDRTQAVRNGKWYHINMIIYYNHYKKGKTKI